MYRSHHRSWSRMMCLWRPIPILSPGRRGRAEQRTYLVGRRRPDSGLCWTRYWKSLARSDDGYVDQLDQLMRELIHSGGIRARRCVLWPPAPRSVAPLPDHFVGIVTVSSPDPTWSRLLASLSRHRQHSSTPVALRQLGTA
jgi:hypothetical protein